MGEYSKSGVFHVYNKCKKVNEERLENGFGWKIHVLSFERADFLKVTKLLLPPLREKEICHKAIEPDKLSELKGTQAGKAITIYPRNKVEFEQVAKEINELLIENNLALNKRDNEFKHQGRVIEKLLRFKEGNSYRLAYRNEFQKKVQGKKVSHEYVSGIHFNISNLEDPFDKEL